GIEHHVDLGELHAFAREQALRRRAIAAKRRRVHDHAFGAHDFTSGRLSARHPAKPPRRLKTLACPALRSSAAALPDVTPLSQAVSTTLFLCFTASLSFSMRASSTLRAFTMCPAWNCAGSRTSITTAPLLMSRTASAVEMCVVPVLRRRNS